MVAVQKASALVAVVQGKRQMGRSGWSRQQQPHLSSAVSVVAVVVTALVAVVVTAKLFLVAEAMVAAMFSADGDERLMSQTGTWTRPPAAIERKFDSKFQNSSNDQCANLKFHTILRLKSTSETFRGWISLKCQVRR